ncbi:hypothetical protein [Parvibaculum sp.]|uniref:hypothetical protein n=1 Tax=Parvibaculum sp. TaxID=2024848 RepID=UPI00391C44E1
MALPVEEIAAHPALLGLVQEQSRVLFAVYEADPRASSVFGNQRYLMGHAAFALYFRRGRADPLGGLTAARFLDEIAKHGIASRNTGDAFLKEMLKYGIVQYMPGAGDGRTRPIEPAPSAIGALHTWVAAQLSTLDRLDGASRGETFATAPDALGTIQPLIADGLFSSGATRDQETAYANFIWVNSRGFVMDWLTSGIGTVTPGAARIPAGHVSIADMASALRLSQTHLARRLREAEEAGGIGWEGARGRSAMWVSQDFLREYLQVQAVKFAIVDTAFDLAFGPCGGSHLRS